MRSIESEGDTIDQAIENALRALNVTRDQVEIEILTGASRGLLGFGGKKARVRATVRAPLLSRLHGLENEAADMDSRETLPPVENDEPAHRQVRDTRTQPPPEAASHAAAPSAAFQLKCKDTLEAILSRLGVSCAVEVGPGQDPGSVLLTVSADSGGLLIGRRGQTLDSLQYIGKRIVGREDAASGRVVIDVERYRERRLEHLTQLARRLAEKAKQTGRPVTLNPPSAPGPRVGPPTPPGGTTTFTPSQGAGPYRKRIILPADRMRRPPRPKPPAS